MISHTHRIILSNHLRRKMVEFYIDPAKNCIPPSVSSTNVCKMSLEEGLRGKRIRSLPLKTGFPCSISAMMQPTDQMSTEEEAEHKIFQTFCYLKGY